MAKLKFFAALTPPQPPLIVHSVVEYSSENKAILQRGVAASPLPPRPRQLNRNHPGILVSKAHRRRSRLAPLVHSPFCYVFFLSLVLKVGLGQKGKPCIWLFQGSRRLDAPPLRKSRVGSCFHFSSSEFRPFTLARDPEAFGAKAPGTRKLFLIPPKRTTHKTQHLTSIYKLQLHAKLSELIVWLVREDGTQWIHWAWLRVHGTKRPHRNHWRCVLLWDVASLYNVTDAGARGAPV